ncbi:hypothetical protein [Companilactobacillus insicii]|uniref:hypothetical protein n=1 Tax=Companilactobacillus insicii TaxID=1732567 RepID=UPI000F789F65|nr:hypothetical protein [Companilactobacillus insicii]
MHFITEQDIQFENRKTPLSKFFLASDDRLTPGARQYLIDHQIKVVDSNSKVDSVATTVEDVAKKTEELNYNFQLLELELQDAALKANEVDLAASQRIFSLSEMPVKIQQDQVVDSLEEIVPSKEEQSQLNKQNLLTPQGKILIKLKRSQVVAESLKGKTTDSQRDSLDSLIQCIDNEIHLLIGEGHDGSE